MESSRLDLAAYHDSGQETQGDSQFKTWQKFKILNSQLLFSFPSMLALPCSSSLMRGMDCDQIVFPWEWREPLIHSGSEPHWISLKCHAAQFPGYLFFIAVLPTVHPDICMILFFHTWIFARLLCYQQGKVTNPPSLCRKGQCPFDSELCWEKWFKLS